MSEEVIANLLSNVGIPAAICFYVLFRVNQTMKDFLTAAINTQTQEEVRRLTEQSSELSMLKDRINELSHRVEAASKKE